MTATVLLSRPLPLELVSPSRLGTSPQLCWIGWKKSLNYRPLTVPVRNDRLNGEEGFNGRKPS